MENYNILLVKEEKLKECEEEKILKTFFKKVDIVNGEKEAKLQFLRKDYAIVVINLITLKIDNIINFIEKIKEANPMQKIVIIASNINEKDFLNIVNSQVDGCLIKPFKIDTFKKLYKKLLYHLEFEKNDEKYKYLLENSLISKTEELKDSFFIDNLTKIYNYNKLKEDLTEIQNDVYLVGVDISNFKNINSIFGIEGGNSVLKECARYLKQIFPDIILYRLQDSSFAYLFPKDVDINSILKLLKRELRELKIDITSIEMKFSFKAIAVSGKEDVLSKYTLISSFLKEKGIKQIYQYFEGEILEIKEKQKNKFFWVNKSLEAVNNSNIEPFFQPIVDNKTKRIYKYEVLARLKNGDNYISPYFFIEPSKEAGVLVPITRMIIEKSFKKIANTNLQISINITSYDFEEGYLEIFLKQQLKENNLSAHQITLEVLEGIESEDNSRYLEQLVKLKEEGFIIAIDDFGTGYSNFQRVYQMNPDFIKIDGIYIKDIDKNESSLKITKAIVSFSKSIGAKVIAEFVENEEIYKITKELGIDYSQGYYFAKPSLEVKKEL